MKKKLNSRQLTAGFTLIETLIVVVMVGVLAAIAAPSWVAFVNARRLSVAQNQIYRTLREAQSNAKRDKIDWQTSFREDYNGVLQVAIHPASVDAPSAGYWKSFDPQVHIVNYDTTLYFDTSTSFWSIQFDYKGNIEFSNQSQLGKITLTTDDPNSARVKRCVIVSTILGAMRNAENDKCS